MKDRYNSRYAFAMIALTVAALAIAGWTGIAQGEDVNLSNDPGYGGDSFVLGASDLLPTTLKIEISGAVYGEQLVISVTDAEGETGTTQFNFMGWDLSGTAYIGQQAPTLPGFYVFKVDFENDTYSGFAVVALNIEQKPITWNGGTVNDKTYDGTTDATIKSVPVFEDALSGDVVTPVVGTVAFVSKNASPNAAVVASGYAIAGADAWKYKAVQPAFADAKIDQLALTIDGVQAVDRIYDATTTVELAGGALVGVLDGDIVDFTLGVGTMADKNAGDKPVTTAIVLTGDDAGNYLLIQPNDLKVNIAKKDVTIEGLSAVDKEYDGTTEVFLIGSPYLDGVIDNDIVALSLNGIGVKFADKNVGKDKEIIIDGYMIVGTDAVNYNLIIPSDVTASITPKELTISGISVLDKEYDGTTTASLTGTAALEGTIAGDDIGFSDENTTANFSDRNIGLKGITVDGYVLIGDDAGNYILVQPQGLTAEISPRVLTINGTAADDKVYDGTTDATVGDAGKLDRVVEGDIVTIVVGTATFADRNVANGIAVSFSGFGIEGDDAGNYVLSGQPADAYADITPKPLTVIGLTAADKIYDGTTNVDLSGTGVLSDGIVGTDDVFLVTGDITAAFADRNAGKDKAVILNGYSLDGADAGNYMLVDGGVTATISPKSVTIIGTTANDKVYNGNATTTVKDIGALEGIVGNDDVTIVAGTATFASKNAGAGILVTFNGFGIAGDDAGNYVLVAQPADAYADIAKADGSGVVIIEGWKAYGLRNTPSVAGVPAEYGDPVFQYKQKDADDSTYVTEVPTQVGTYMVRAVFAETANYNAYTTEAVEFEITADPVAGGMPMAWVIVGILVLLILIFAIYWFVLQKKTVADLGNIFRRG
ncbi:MAG: YDG domain-containing protein [Methanomassiliicoccaceae archaeon]|nr:YDG domain-containing protein [Methanomassiliicoccaceae archaeon]